MKGRKIQSAFEGWAELKRIIFPPWWRYYFSIRSQLRSADLGSMRRSSAVIMFHDRTEGPDQQNLKKKRKPVRAKLRRWCRLSEASFQLKLLTHVVLSGQVILATLRTTNSKYEAATRPPPQQMWSRLICFCTLSSVCCFFFLVITIRKCPNLHGYMKLRANKGHLADRSYLSSVVFMHLQRGKRGKFLLVLLP